MHALCFPPIPPSSTPSTTPNPRTGGSCLPQRILILLSLTRATEVFSKSTEPFLSISTPVMVGLTATPKTDVDRNTYDFFEMEHGVPTYAYDYETAVEQDHVLVPYYNYEVKTEFQEKGITYNKLSDEDKERFEEDFIEDGTMPEFIPSADLNSLCLTRQLLILCCRI